MRLEKNMNGKVVAEIEEKIEELKNFNYEGYSHLAIILDQEYNENVITGLKMALDIIKANTES